MITLAAPWTATSQRRVFRALLDAQARPGSVHDLGEAGARASLAVLATLCDGATTLADPHGLLSAADRSRLGAVPAEIASAMFVHAAAAQPIEDAPCRGDLLTPERGATVVLDCYAVGEGHAVRLSGPGVDGATELRVLGLDAWWIQARNAWCARFPLGVDLVLCDARRIAAIPRSIRCEG
jgi:alpha-D-ribose 1-methylphosphonate 5-triphosphate synthase subunit PhnH